VENIIRHFKPFRTIQADFLQESPRGLRIIRRWIINSIHPEINYGNYIKRFKKLTYIFPLTLTLSRMGRGNNSPPLMGGDKGEGEINV
jgi:hypothetical protein